MKTTTPNNSLKKFFAKCSPSKEFMEQCDAHWKNHITSNASELSDSIHRQLEWYWQGVTTLKQCAEKMNPLLSELVWVSMKQQEPDLFEATLAEVDHGFINFDPEKHCFAFNVTDDGVGGTIFIVTFGSATDATKRVQFTKTGPIFLHG